MKGWGEKNKYFHANFLCFKGGKVMFEKDSLVPYVVEQTSKGERSKS